MIIIVWWAAEPPEAREQAIFTLRAQRAGQNSAKAALFRRRGLWQDGGNWPGEAMDAVEGRLEMPGSTGRRPGDAHRELWKAPLWKEGERKGQTREHPVSPLAGGHRACREAHS